MCLEIAVPFYSIGRRLERAERTVRALRVQLELTAELPPQDVPLDWLRLINGLGRGDLLAELSADPRATSLALLFDRHPSSVRSGIHRAHEDALGLRPVLNDALWEPLHELYLLLDRSSPERAWREGIGALLAQVEGSIGVFWQRGEAAPDPDRGWLFARLGRLLERACGTLRLLSAHAGLQSRRLAAEPTPQDRVAWSGLLKKCAAHDAYRRIRRAGPSPQQVLAFVLLDTRLPQSVRWAAREIADVVAAIGWDDPRSDAVARTVRRLGAELEATAMHAALQADVSRYLGLVGSACRELHEAVKARWAEGASSAAAGPLQQLTS